MEKKNFEANVLLQRKKEETKLASIKLYSRLALKKILRNMLWEYQSVVGFPCPSKPTEGKKINPIVLKGSPCVCIPSSQFPVPLVLLHL